MPQRWCYVMCSGAAKSQEEAERICEALRTAGVVLRAYDVVYLKPDDITETILRVRMAPCVHVEAAQTFILPCLPRIIEHAV